MNRYAFENMTVGVCYYPEHWDRTLWEDDIRRMLDSGITVVRIAEFAWSLFERTEGAFTLEYFDPFLDLCERLGMKVIFGTPTATPPAWLTEQYPETLNCDIAGVKYRHGMRRHYNYNSSVYREKCAIIVEKIARHYGMRPCIIGWQIDNELNCEKDEFYAEADSMAFRAFLKEKYGTLDKLNDAWGTVFWSQTYTDWEQVYVPRPAPHAAYNPHLHLDYLRFISHSCLDFCAMQANILRMHIAPGAFITTNGMFGHMDNHAMTHDTLDIYTYDSYPNFAFGLDVKNIESNLLRDRWSGMKLSEVRSVCKHFGIMEQQSGAGSWTSRMDNPMPRPGQMTLWALQSVAHGADFVSFFRWRTCTFGTEIYWHGILGYDNRDNRRMDELRDFAAKMKKLSPVCGADYAAQIALVRDYDNIFDSELDRWHRSVTRQSEDAVFEVSQLYHTPMDMLYLQPYTTLEDLKKYKALIMPHASIMTGERAGLLEQYVRQGGTLVIGCRSGYKDEHGRCVMTPQPGLLQPLTATDVTEYTFASPAEEEPYAIWHGERMPMPVFNDVLTPLAGTDVLARFGTSYYEGEAALTERRAGDGRVLHLGGAFSREAARMILDHLGLLEPFADVVSAPQEVELIFRQKGEKQYLFALNYQMAAMTVTLHQKAYALFAQAYVQGNVTLAPYGVEVFELK
ncbi:MAG: beta-galactosidase [Clostridia bacterium]|nr:beta-galactosidase [Clostridia bacterium]